jgi:hypothetical protein
VDKTRLLVICGFILSVFVPIALAADTNDVNEPAENEAVMQLEDVNEAQTEVPDTNSPEAKLNKAWSDAERANDSEAKGWLKLEMAERINFARTAQRTTETQLELLKMIAESEGATQTVAAIDKLLEDRAAKVDEVLDQAREERRQERIKELEEKRKAKEEMRQNRQQNREQK